MRRIGANYIITNTGQALRNAYLEVDENGVILKVIETQGHLQEVANLEFYNGVIIPGFVNTHAHLELSYMKGVIEPQKGLPHFISSLQKTRQTSDKKVISEAIEKANSEMQSEGIVLVGDISNSTDSIDCKIKSSIEYKTFVEVFGLDKYLAHELFDKAKLIQNDFRTHKLQASISPHAPYSVSGKLFELITELSYQENSTISIHNQETESENQMFIDKTGALVDFFKSIKLNLSNFYPTGYNSLPSTLIQLPKCSKLNLVHNTFSSQEDIDKVLAYNSHSYWTLCPNANLYIENRLPDINLLYKNGLRLCLGTDSLASNYQLSILEELKTIQKHFPLIPFLDLIKWSSYNGADALDKLSTYGSFEEGKKPGVLLIENFDFDSFKLKDTSKVNVLI